MRQRETAGQENRTALTQIFTAERDLLLANRSFAMCILGIFLNNDHLLCE
jgi:hypothetical protein